MARLLVGTSITGGDPYASAHSPISLVPAGRICGELEHVPAFQGARYALIDLVAGTTPATGAGGALPDADNEDVRDVLEGAADEGRGVSLL